MKKSSIKLTIFRYILLLILGLGNLFIFYLILAPLTIYPVLWILSLFYDPVLLSGGPTLVCELATKMHFLKSLACMNTTIFFDSYYASIIPACIAGSAYYLLLIINLTTPMKINQRVKSLFFVLLIFLFINILRIFSFAMIFANKNYDLFSLAHVSAWYFGSTVLVILLWFTSAYLFKIKSIPVYTDIKEISSKIKRSKRK